MAQAVRIFVDVLQRGTFGTDVTAAERILAIAADGDDPRAVDLDLEPADRLAEIARAENGAHRAKHYTVAQAPPPLATGDTQHDADAFFVSGRLSSSTTNTSHSLPSGSCTQVLSCFA